MSIPPKASLKSNGSAVRCVRVPLSPAELETMGSIAPRAAPNRARA